MLFNLLPPPKCDVCNGKPNKCSTCSGKKKITCLECDGKKMSFVFSKSDPFTDECTYCNGFGKIFGNSSKKMKKCPDCGGRGWKHFTSTTYDGVEDCLICDKRGEHECYTCYGSGINNNCFCHELEQKAQIEFGDKEKMFVFFVIIFLSCILVLFS